MVRQNEAGVRIVQENTHFCGSKTDSTGEKIIHVGKHWGYEKKKKEGVVKKEEGRSSFSSTLNTHETFRACSLMAIARLNHLIVNTATGCCTHGQALALNTVIAASFCTVFQPRKK